MLFSKALNADDWIKFLKLPTQEMIAQLPPLVQQAGRMVSRPIRKINQATPGPVKVAVTVPVLASIPAIPAGMMLAAGGLNFVARLAHPVVRLFDEERPTTRPDN